MKKIMVLGAGVYQLPLIRKIREMGYYSIVVSIPGKYPGFSAADKVYYENTTNTDTVLKIAMEEKIDAVCLCGTDVAMNTLGSICDAMGLCGPSKSAVETASYKAAMKDSFKKGGVRSSAFAAVSLSSALSDIEEICDDIGYPVIFKAEDSSGSRGIIKVSCKADVLNGRECVYKVTRSDKFIIEKFIDGWEFGAQAFICGGEIRMYMPHGDYVFHGNTGVPVGHYIPLGLDEGVYNDSLEQTMRSVQSCGLDNCAVNMDFILSGGKVYVLEIGARAGGTCLPELVSAYYGIDYYEYIINLALGNGGGEGPAR